MAEERPRDQRVTVADLLARMHAAETGADPQPEQTRRPAPPPRPTPEPPPVAPPPAKPMPAMPMPAVASAPVAPPPLDAPPAPASPAPAPPPPAPARRRLPRTALLAGRVTLALAAVVALVGTGTVWTYLHARDNAFNQVRALDENDPNVRREGQEGDENYLIVGTDTRAGANGRIGAGTTAETEGSRSDSVILLNIPANRSRVVGVSFPRDLSVDRPDCQAWDNQKETYTDETIPAETNAKLNTAFGVGGPRCLVSVLQQMTHLKINHFISIDFVGFEKMVDKVGGVEVCSPQPLYDEELGRILSKSGKQQVKGKAALNYVRARKISAEGNGDYGRIKRQQLFLSSLLRSMLSNQVLSNPGTLNGLITAFQQYALVERITTDDLLDLASSLRDLQASRVTFATVPTAGTMEDGSGNEIPRTDDIRALFDAIIDDDPLPGEGTAGKKPAPTPTPTEVADRPQAPAPKPAVARTPSAVTVRVLNGTAQPGRASSVAESLDRRGFGSAGIADASMPQDESVVRYAPGERDAAATIAAMIPGTAIQEDRTLSSGVALIVGRGFTELGKIPAAGSALTPKDLPAIKSGSLPSDLAVTNAATTACD